MSLRVDLEMNRYWWGTSESPSDSDDSSVSLSISIWCLVLHCRISILRAWFRTKSRGLSGSRVKGFTSLTRSHSKMADLSNEWPAFVMRGWTMISSVSGQRYFSGTLSIFMVESWLKRIWWKSWVKFFMVWWKSWVNFFMVWASKLSRAKIFSFFRLLSTLACLKQWARCCWKCGLHGLWVRQNEIGCSRRKRGRTIHNLCDRYNMET